MANRPTELAAFIRSSGEADGWIEESFKEPYVAFNPDVLMYNDTLFNELLLSAHALKINSIQDVQSDDTVEDAGDIGNEVIHSELVTFIETAADVYALDRQCLVCRVLDMYRRNFGLSALWMADYAFLCSKCLGSPPCATATFIAAFEFVYIMDKHFLSDHGCTLVRSFGKKLLTLEDIQRHFFLHGCFRTDGGVPGRRHDEVITSRSKQGRLVGRRGKFSTAGDAKVLYSNYSYLAQSATRALLMTLSDLGSAPLEVIEGRQKSISGDVRNELRDGIESRKRVAHVIHSVGPVHSCPTTLSVALAGWKDCAKNVECNFFQLESCTLRASSEDNDYEHEWELRASEEKLNVVENVQDMQQIDASQCEHHEHARNEDCTMGYGNLVLLLLAGTGSAPEAASELAFMAAKVRRETVDIFWKNHRREFANDVTAAYSACYGEDSEPDLELGPLMITQLKHAITKGGTSAECLLCNLLLIRTYWLAMRKFKRDIITYSANNIGLFHSIEPVLDAWRSQGHRTDLGDEGCFVTLMKSAGTEAIYKHLFCDPMCAARIAQTNPRSLFDHPDATNHDELALYKARLASQNHFGGRVCAGLWALAYTFKTYQVFPPRPTALSAFVKDAGALLQRHSISLISLEHTLGVYV